jgi:hypothetical protein
MSYASESEKASSSIGIHIHSFVTRVVAIDQGGTVLFLLFDLVIPSSPDILIVLRDGCKHLRLNG